MSEWSRQTECNQKGILVENNDQRSKIIFKKNQANYDEVKTRLCCVCFVVVVGNVVVVVLIVVAVHKGLVVVNKSLSDTH